jgi:hypothetical protein
MKINWKKVFYFVMFLGSLVGFKNVVGQNDSINKKSNYHQENSYYVNGQIFELDSATPIPFCNIKLTDEKAKLIMGSQSDFDGYFKMYPVPKGVYTLSVSFVGYKKYVIENFEVNQNIDFKIRLEQSLGDLEIYEMQCYQTPLIDRSRTRSMETFDSNDIQRMPGRR